MKMMMYPSTYRRYPNPPLPPSLTESEPGGETNNMIPNPGPAPLCIRLHNRKGGSGRKAE